MSQSAGIFLFVCRFLAPNRPKILIGGFVFSWIKIYNFDYVNTLEFFLTSLLFHINIVV